MIGAVEVIPPPPPQIAGANAAGRALAVGTEIVGAVTITLELSDGTSVEAMTTDQGVGMLLDLLRTAQREARRQANVAAARKAHR